MSTCGCVAREPLFRCLCPRYRFSQRGGREHRVQVQTRFWTPHCPHCSPREQVSVAVFREQRVPLGTCPAVVTGTVYVTAPVCSGKWVRVTAVMSEGGQVSGGPAVMCVYVLARSRQLPVHMDRQTEPCALCFHGAPRAVIGCH